MESMIETYLLVWSRLAQGAPNQKLMGYDEMMWKEERRMELVKGKEIKEERKAEIEKI